MLKTANKKEQIEMHLRSEIRRGRWALGEQMPVEDELLHEVNVGRSTIREALNSLMAEGIIVRKHGIGTFVERIPLSGIAVCAWFENLVSPAGYWYRELVSGIRRFVEGEHLRFDILVGNGQSIYSAVSSIGKYINGPASKDFVGAINLMPNGSLENWFSSLGIPVVNIQIGVPLGRYCVVLDYGGMMESVLEIMHGHGIDDFAVLYTDDPPEDVGERSYEERESWLRTLVGSDSSRLVPVSTIDHAYDGFRQWWATRRTNGIFFMDDSVYEAASRAMLELGIRVPEDLRVVTHANVGRQFHIPYPVDRVGFDVNDVIHRAWDMMDSLVRGVRVDSRIVHISPQCQRDSHEQRQPLVYHK